MPSLPLTLFERYLFHEDRPEHPCWFFFRLRFAGRLRRDTLQRAWEQVVARHPLLSCIVKRDWRGRLVWEPMPDYRPTVHWTDQLDPSGWPKWTWVALTDFPGIQLSAHESGDRTDFFIHAHHSVHDGAAHLAIIEDLFVHYARELGTDVPLIDYDQSRLADRNNFGLTWWDKVKLVPMQLLGLAASAQLHWRTPRTLGSATIVPKDAPAVVSFPVLTGRQLSVDESEWLEHTAKLLHAPLHELLVRDAQAGVGAWLGNRPDAKPLDWVYLLVPVHLRRPSDVTTPAANIVGIVILARQLKSLAASRRERLLQRVCEDMAWIKRGRFGYVFSIVLWLCSLWPGGIRRYSHARACRTTLLFTNLGKIFSTSRLVNSAGQLTVPGAVLEQINIAPPCRPGTHAGLAVSLYAGRFSADLQYDPRALTREEGEALLDSFMQQLRLSMESVG